MDILDDFFFLNSQLLLLASDPRHGGHYLHMLGAHPRVIKVIAGAGNQGILTALRCRVPLLTFTAALEELVRLSEAELRATHPVDVPEELRQLTTVALHVAHRLAHIDRLQAQEKFGLTPRQCERFMQLGIGRLTRLRDRRGLLVRLRAPDRVVTWQRLLIGDGFPGARGFRIAQQAASQSLG